MNTKQNFYDEFYKTHGAKVHDDPVRFSKIAELCKGLVLDLGCGTGTLADFYKGFYSGVDISEVAIEAAKKTRRPEVDFKQADICDYRIYDGCQFDTIVIAEVLEHLDDDKELFDNVKRLLTPNGRLIISVPNGDRVPDSDHRRQFSVPQIRDRFSIFGRVVFCNYAGFAERILFYVDFGSQPRNDLGLSMVIKNEGLGLENAILSCIEHVDQIAIIVDTTSDDNSKKIAQMYADKFADYFWENSFCKARNTVQKMLTTEWALIIDGHEYVESMPDLTNFFTSKYTGIRAEVRLENGFRFNSPRIIRQNVVWTKDVHNYPETPLNALCEGFVVVHDREGKQSAKSKEIRDKQRNEMIEKFMKAEIKKDPKAFTPWYYLGQHAFLNQKFKKGIKYYKQYLKRSNWKGERWLVYYDMAQAHANLGHFVRAMWALRDACKEIPNRWEINFAAGLIAMQTKKYRRAIDLFVESFNENPGRFTYYPVKKDNSFVWYCIGNCCEKLRDFDTAKKAYFRSLELEKEKPEKEQNQEQIKILNFILKVV
jgi:SAM-dependent methyltransferase/Tfp pilus assembly protein PilF